MTIGQFTGSGASDPRAGRFASAACRKGPERQGRILFIDAVNEVARERARSTLKPEHQRRIQAAYEAFAGEPGFARVATQEEIA